MSPLIPYMIVQIRKVPSIWGVAVEGLGKVVANGFVIDGVVKS